MTQQEIMELFIEDLEDSLESIHDFYQGLHYWEHTQEFLRQYGPLAVRFLKPYLDRYHERVFCYELYHQLRARMEGRKEEEDNFYLRESIFLQSELIKNEIGTFVEIVFKIERLSKEFMPDFLLHTPGNFSNQLIIMEVKSDPKIGFDDVTYDLNKISEFINNYKYHKGVFIAINIDPWRQESSLERLKEWKKKNDIGNHDITLYFKENPWTKFTKHQLVDV